MAVLAVVALLVIDNGTEERTPPADGGVEARGTSGATGTAGLGKERLGPPESSETSTEEDPVEQESGSVATVVRGVAVRADSTPLSGVKVRIIPPAGPGFVQVLGSSFKKTDAEGRFSFRLRRLKAVGQPLGFTVDRGEAGNCLFEVEKMRVLRGEELVLRWPAFSSRTRVVVPRFLLELPDLEAHIYPRQSEELVVNPSGFIDLGVLPGGDYQLSVSSGSPSDKTHPLNKFAVKFRIQASQPLVLVADTSSISGQVSGELDPQLTWWIQARSFDSTEHTQIVNTTRLDSHGRFELPVIERGNWCFSLFWRIPDDKGWGIAGQTVVYGGTRNFIELPVFQGSLRIRHSKALHRRGAARILLQVVGDRERQWSIPLAGKDDVELRWFPPAADPKGDRLKVVVFASSGEVLSRTTIEYPKEEVELIEIRK